MFEEKQAKAKNTLPEALSPQRHGAAPLVSAQLQRQVLAGQQLAVQTLRPVALQRQQASPVLQALQLQREAEVGLEVQRQALQRQVDQSPLPIGAAETALQRQTTRQTPAAPLKQAPSTPAEWVQAARLAVQRVQDPTAPHQTHWLSGADRERHLGTLRSVGQGLAQGFKTDQGPAVQRYAEYGESLATLQRQPLTGAVPRMVLAQVSPAERPMLQRAIDEALQRQAEQDMQDQAALHQHALQRQLAEMDHQAEQPILQRIQARRGGGTPLPVSVQRQLEAGLNHDLSGVRVHTDTEADLLSKKVSAVAFTTGQDIYFQSGKFDPNSKTGIELLAHEATHTVQQSKGQVGKGIDPDAGLEQEARSTGARIAHAVQPPGRQAARPAQRHRTGVGATFTPITTVQRLGGASPTAVSPVLTVGKLGIVKQADGANVHASPDPKSALVVPQPITLGTRVGVISRTADGWSRISLPSGKSGYIQTARVTTDLPDPAASLIRVTGGQTAIGVAERYYKSLVKPGQDLRYYVNVLEYLDKQRGTGAFQSGQTLKAGSVLWVPGVQMAQSLVGQVGSGSITGGRWAEAKSAVGNGPGANILRSVMESPQYISEVLGETWKSVKQHWPALLATTIALVGAEMLVGVLAAAPEPTMITKFIAVALQGMITAVTGTFFALGAAQAAIDGHIWLTTAWTAKGDTGKLKIASKAFLGMIGNVVVALLSVTGVRSSVIKTAKLTTLATRESLIAQIGSKATYEALMDTLRSQGVAKNNAQILKGFLSKVPDPLELKGLLDAVHNVGLLSRLLDAAARLNLRPVKITEMFQAYAPNVGKYLEKSPASELEAALKGFELEQLDSGHSLARHGPQVTDLLLKQRVTQGIAPDGVVSPASPSTRFKSFADWIGTREAVFKKFIPSPSDGPGINGNPALTNGSTKVVTEFSSRGQLGEGFEGVGTKGPIPDPRGPRPNGNPRTINVHPSARPVGPGMNRTRTTFTWEADVVTPGRGQWKVVQHFPEGIGFDSSTRQYSVPPDQIIP